MTPEETKKIGDPSPRAIDFAKRMIALKWTKETNVETVACNWQAGYVAAQVAAASQSGWIDEGIKYLRDLYSEVTDLERDKKQMERPFIIGIKKYLNHCHPNPNNHDTAGT